MNSPCIMYFVGKLLCLIVCIYSGYQGHNSTIMVSHILLKRALLILIWLSLYKIRKKCKFDKYCAQNPKSFRDENYTRVLISFSGRVTLEHERKLPKVICLYQCYQKKLEGVFFWFSFYTTVKHRGHWSFYILLLLAIES